MPRCGAFYVRVKFEKGQTPTRNIWIRDLILYILAHENKITANLQDSNVVQNDHTFEEVVRMKQKNPELNHKVSYIYMKIFMSIIKFSIIFWIQAVKDITTKYSQSSRLYHALNDSIEINLNVFSCKNDNNDKNWLISFKVRL